MASYSANDDEAVSPRHYQHGEIETIDYILAVCRSLDGDEAALVTNILKYVSRYRGKGTPKRDLAKAAWYLQRLQKEVCKKQGEEEC